jgi:uncharacterized protein YbaR (Trm112 family)
MSDRVSDPKPLALTCPLCRGQLTVDPASGHVLHAAAPRAGTTTFETALGEVHSAEARRERDFVDAFSREQTRRDLLDKKFETAKEKAEQDKSPRVNPLDID